MVSSNDKFSTKQYTIDNLCESIKEDEIDVNPIWQRKVVWNNKMKKDLVDTIMKGYPINPIVVWDQGQRSVCVDGKNRLCAINDFKENEFPVRVEGGEKFFKELDKREQRRFGMFNIEVRVLRSDVWNDRTVREYFQSIQGGSKLNWNERINAIDNWFVDLLRDIMIETEEQFKTVLPPSCNDRFELYTYIANIISTDEVIQSKYKGTDSRQQRTADTNSSLMKFVVNFNDDTTGIDNIQKCKLVKLVKDVITVVSQLKQMQEDEMTENNVSIWFLTLSDKVSAKTKPCIKDFTSIAFYIQQNPTDGLEVVINNLKTIFRGLVATFFENDKHPDIIDYYITYGKNQRQYAWSSVQKRYNIMAKYLQ